jgi:hypothetical protein
MSNYNNTIERKSEIQKKKEENGSEMIHSNSNSKFRLQSNEKSLSKKSLPSTPAIIGIVDQAVNERNLNKNGS